MTAYVVYDTATKAIIKSGIAADPDDAASQVDDEATQAVVAADSSEELATATAPLSLGGG
jgi:hypothetical protein